MFEKDDATTKTMNTDGNRKDMLSDTALQHTSNLQSKDTQKSSDSSTSTENSAIKFCLLENEGKVKQIPSHRSRSFRAVSQAITVNEKVSDTKLENFIEVAKSESQKFPESEYFISYLNNDGFVFAYWRMKGGKTLDLITLQSSSDVQNHYHSMKICYLERLKISKICC